jgi:hypothetical protein
MGFYGKVVRLRLAFLFMKLSKKLELTAVGYLFTALNLFMTLQGFPIVGIGFGFVAVFFFIKALLIKPDK